MFSESWWNYRQESALYHAGSKPNLVVGLSSVSSSAHYHQHLPNVVGSGTTSRPEVSSSPAEPPTLPSTSPRSSLWLSRKLEELGGLEWREERTRCPGPSGPSARYEPEGYCCCQPWKPPLVLWRQVCSPPPSLRHQHLQPDHVGLARDKEEGGGGAGGGQGLQ